LFIVVLIEGSFHTNTNTTSIRKGIHARATCQRVRETAPKDSSMCEGSLSNRHTRHGCQKRRKIMVHTNDTNPLAMSTRLLSMKFDQTNCVIANEIPTTRI